MDVCISWCTIEESCNHNYSGYGRTASSDLTIRPLLPTSEDLGMNTVLLAANCEGTYLYAKNMNWEPRPPAHLVAMVPFLLDARLGDLSPIGA